MPPDDRARTPEMRRSRFNQHVDRSVQLSEGMEIIGAASQFDPAVAKLANPMEITKDMLRRIGWPESWLNDEKRLAAAVEQMQQEQQAAAMAADVGGAAEVANKAAPMVKALAGAA